MCLLEGSNIDHTKLQLNDNQCKGQLDGQRHMVTFTFNNSQPCGAEVTVGFPPPPLLLVLLFFFSSTSLSPPLLPPSPLLLHSDFSFSTPPPPSTSPRPVLLLLLLVLSDSWFGLLLLLVPLHPIPFLSDFSPFPSSNPLPLYVTAQTDNHQAIFKNTLSTMNSSSNEIIVRHDQVVLNFSCLYDAEKPQSATFKIKDGCV